MAFFGQVAEWLKASDCKSDLIRVRRFESFPAHRIVACRAPGVECNDLAPGIRHPALPCGSSSDGRASAFQAEGREFESRLPLNRMAIVERRVLNVMIRRAAFGTRHSLAALAQW